MSSKKLLGDFQTPEWFARQVTEYALSISAVSDVVVEPTCGKGAFTKALCELGYSKTIIANELNTEYLDSAKQKSGCDIEWLNQDFFDLDWSSLLRGKDQVLLLGNPPWVTNSQLSSNGLGKHKASGFRGLDSGFSALLGGANYDITESIVFLLIASVLSAEFTLCMIVKTKTARRIAEQLNQKLPQKLRYEIHAIDAKQIFNVSVGACVFVVQSSASQRKSFYSSLFGDLGEVSPLSFSGKRLIKSSLPPEAAGKDGSIGDLQVWRSGVKHDCASVLELEKIKDGCYLNKLGDEVKLEDNLVFPLVKASTLMNNKRQSGKYLLLPHKGYSLDLDQLRQDYPQTAAYLELNRMYFNRRKSSIYQKGELSVFGIGDYTFKPIKIAISGFQKSSQFHLFDESREGFVVFDDTIYFLSFASTEIDKARLLLNHLNSVEVKELLSSSIWVDDKRPFTSKLLNSIPLPTSLIVESNQTQLQF